MTPVRTVAFLCCVGLCLARPGAAQESAPDVAALRAELEALRQEYRSKLADLESRLAQLETGGAAAAATPPPSPPSVAAAPAQTTNYFNPAMSVIGNFIAAGGHNTVDAGRAASLEESEIGLQAVIDPYARADFFLAFGEEGAEVEEGYVTFTALPQSLLAKVGRMKVDFGKVNALHPHNLPWADKPLVIVNLLGGDEGWIGDGASVARLIPLGDTFSELTLQVLDGDAGEEFFTAERRSDLSYNAHYRLFRDLSESTNLDLGLSYGRGPNGGLADTELEGVDVTLRWKPLRTATYRSADLRGEFFRSRRAVEDLGRRTANGWYLGANYRLAKRWWIGGRYDSSERALDAALRDTAESLVLSFNPTEFSQLRGQLRRRHFADAETTNELLLQLLFAIGAHGAHPF